MRRHKRSLGFTLLELVVVVSVIGLLAVVALDRLLVVQEQAEKVVMEQTAGILRSAMQLQMADLIAHQRAAEIAGLAGQNPMNWLAEKPGNYLGEFSGAPQTDVPRGSWYFDTQDRALVYLVDRGRYFVPDPRGRKQVRYRVFLVRAPSEQPGRADISAVEGVTLKTLEPYKWF